MTHDDRGLPAALSAVSVRNASLEAARDILPRDLFDIVRTYAVPLMSRATVRCYHCRMPFCSVRGCGDSPVDMWGDSRPPREWLKLHYPWRDLMALRTCSHGLRDIDLWFLDEYFTFDRPVHRAAKWGDFFSRCMPDPVFIDSHVVFLDPYLYDPRIPLGSGCTLRNT